MVMKTDSDKPTGTGNTKTDEAKATSKAADKTTTASDADLHTYAASGDPEVHRLLAERQTAVMNEEPTADIDKALADAYASAGQPPAVTTQDNRYGG